MSAVQAPQSAGQHPGAPTRLRAIPNRPRRLAQLPFMLIVAALLGGGMAGVVLLSTTIQAQSAELGELQNQQVQLGHQQAALVAEVQDLRSSQNLANRAWQLGMRPNPNPAFIQMPDGRVFGVPTQVTGDELPGMVPAATTGQTPPGRSAGADQSPAATPAASSTTGVESAGPAAPAGAAGGASESTSAAQPITDQEPR